MSNSGDLSNQPPAAEPVTFAVGGTQPPLPPEGTAFPPATPPRKRGVGVGLAAGAVALALVAGGAVWAVSAMNSDEAGQPESMVPASAIGFADVDFDPPAGQKLAAYRYLQKFPKVGGGSGEGDLLGQIVGGALKADPSSGVNYETDVKPWLGKRAGIAAVPATAGATDKEPQPLLVLQVTDEDKARTSLRALLDKAKSSEAASTGTAALLPTDTDEQLQGLVVRDGWALIGPDQAATEAMSTAAAEADLGGSATFTDDHDKLGGDAVVTTWVDVTAVTKAIEDSGAADEFTAGFGTFTGSATQGRFVASLRFDGNTAVVSARQFGGKPSTIANTAPGGPLVAKLPAGTTAGIGVGNASATVAEMYDQLVGSAGGALVRDQVKQATGLNLPTDLQDLVGDAFVVSVGDVNAANPQFAARVRTADAAASRRVFDTVVGLLDQPGIGAVPRPITVPAADGVVYALSPGYGALVAKDGTLGESAGFKAALPDAATAGIAVYVDLAKLAALDADTAADLGPLSVLGLSATTEGSDSTMTVRLVAK